MQALNAQFFDEFDLKMSLVEVLLGSRRMKTVCRGIRLLGNHACITSF